MAVRIEFFSIAGAADFELVAPSSLDAAVAAFDTGSGSGDASADVRCIGWLSAADDDEEEFTAWCAEVDDDLGVGFLSQGVDEAVGLPVPDPGDAGDDRQAAWAATLRAVLVAAGGGRIGWRTNFDVGGTAGTHEDYPTATSGAG
jgi:hypothetical protein